jgi:uncharacterized protein (DUF1501 family)
MYTFFEGGGKTLIHTFEAWDTHDAQEQRKETLAMPHKTHALSTMIRQR